MMSTPIVHCQWEDETGRERTCHPGSHDDSIRIEVDNTSDRWLRKASIKSVPFLLLLFFCIFFFTFIRAISRAPLQVLYYSEALPTQHGYCAAISRRSATAN